MCPWAMHLINSFSACHGTEDLEGAPAQGCKVDSSSFGSATIQTATFMCLRKQQDRSFFFKILFILNSSLVVCWIHWLSSLPLVIPDPIKTAQGSLSLKAYRLTPKLMEICKEKDFTPEGWVAHRATRRKKDSVWISVMKSMRAAVQMFTNNSRVCFCAHVETLLGKTGFKNYIAFCCFDSASSAVAKERRLAAVWRWTLMATIYQLVLARQTNVPCLRFSDPKAYRNCF